MGDVRQNWGRDALLRLMGVALLASCGLLMRWLFHAHGVGQRQEGTFVEFAAAMADFLCFSIGAALTTLGAHIFDQVEISERWATGRGTPARPGSSRELSMIITLHDQDSLATRSDVAAEHAAAPWGSRSGHANQ